MQTSVPQLIPLNIVTCTQNNLACVHVGGRGVTAFYFPLMEIS